MTCIFGPFCARWTFEDTNTIQAQTAILMLHKPKGVVVTREDERKRKTVYDILPAWVQADGWIPVGRLDMDSRGLLLFVKDGRLMDRLSRPGRMIKTYEVWVRGRVTDEHLAAIRAGIPTPVGILSAVEIKRLGGAGQKTRLQVELDEGKNRHIRRMFGALNDPERDTPLKVLELKRIKFGNLTLDVPSGAWRFLTEVEVASLLSLLSLP